MKSYDEVINIYPELNDKKSKKSQNVKLNANRFDQLTRKKVSNDSKN